MIAPADPALRREMEEDERMARVAFDRYGKDKCVRIGCPTMIEPLLNRDGFCSFHRRKVKS